MKKAKKIPKKKVKLGPPFHNGVEPKVSRLFTLDPSIFAEFRRHCLANKIKMSECVQEMMHAYNVKYSMEHN